MFDRNSYLLNGLHCMSEVGNLICFLLWVS